MNVYATIKQKLHPFLCLHTRVILICAQLVFSKHKAHLKARSNKMLLPKLIKVHFSRV